MLIRYLAAKLLLFLAMGVFLSATLYSFGPPIQAKSPQTIALAIDKEPVPNVQAVTHVGKPSRLIIPSIDVDAEVEHLGLTVEGAVKAPDSGKKVSWFDLGPRPGQKGSALISGHYGIWRNNSNSVFNLLPTLRIGEEVQVEDDAGKILSFTVVDRKVYGKDDTVPELFYRNDGNYLNIITCHGTWLPSQQTYDKRLVIFTQLTGG